MFSIIEIPEKQELQQITLNNPLTATGEYSCHPLLMEFLLLTIILVPTSTYISE